MGVYFHYIGSNTGGPWTSTFTKDAFYHQHGFGTPDNTNGFHYWKAKFSENLVLVAPIEGKWVLACSTHADVN